MHILKSGVIYLGTSIVNKAVPFLLLPVVTHFLSPESFGQLSIFLAIQLFAQAFIGMALHTNVATNFFCKDRHEMAVIMGNIFLLLSTTVVAGLLLAGLFAVFFDQFFSVPARYLLVIPLICFFLMANTLNLAVLRCENRAYTYGIFEVGNMLIKNGAFIFLLVIAGIDWESSFISTTISGLIFFIIALAYLNKRKYLALQYNKQAMTSILQISLPLIPHALCASVISMSDRLFIEKMLSIEAVGLYSIAYSFGMIVSLFTDAFIKAWNPWFFKTLAAPSENNKLLVVRYIYLYLIILLIGTLALSLIAQFVLPWVVADAYHEAADLVPWIAFAYAMQGVYKIFFPFLVMLKKTGFLAKSTLISGVASLVCNYFLIMHLGLIGAALSTIIAFSINALLVFIYQKNHFSMPWLMKS